MPSNVNSILALIFCFSGFIDAIAASSNSSEATGRIAEARDSWLTAFKSKDVGAAVGFYAEGLESYSTIRRNGDEYYHAVCIPAQKTAFHYGGAYQQSKSFAGWNQSLRRRPLGKNFAFVES